MDGNRIKTLGTPSASTDAANKSYVDKFLPLAGGTMTGTLNARQLTCVGFAGHNSHGYYQFYIGNPKNNLAGWYLGNQNQTPTNTDNDFYFSVQYPNGNINTAGYISDSSNNVKMNFTGQHRCECLTPIDQLVPGLILEATGKYHNMFGTNRDVPSVSDSIPIVQVCDTIRSKKVFGVYSEKEDKREYRAGNFVSTYIKNDNDDRVFVNSLGEGGILVCNSSGNIANGDYIECFRMGYGQKQKSGMMRNTTVAKSTQDCDFTDSTTSIDVSGITYKIMFIGVTYHCG